MQEEAIRQQTRDFPCSSCDTGWESISQWLTDEEGFLTLETKGCTEACSSLAGYYKEERKK